MCRAAWVATHGDHDHNIFEGVDPLATLSFTVGVASKTILLLQSVVGDAGGATARYELDRTCGKPEESDIPGPLLPRAPETLIREIEPVILVELREGRFNITPALADDPAGGDAFDGVAVSVLDNEGETCNATVSGNAPTAAVRPGQGRNHHQPHQGARTHGSRVRDHLRRRGGRLVRRWDRCGH